MTVSKLLHRLSDYCLSKAMTLEGRRANLTHARVQLSYGHIDYLYRHSGRHQETEAVVMLHGATSDKSAWLGLTKCLRMEKSVFIPDLPGHGHSVSEMNVNYGYHAQVLRLREWLAALGIERAHLIGNSMGGAIALHWAACFPEQIASLILIDSIGVEVRSSWLREQVARTGNNPMITIRNAEDYRAMLAIGMQRPPAIPAFIISALARRYHQRIGINNKVLADIEAEWDLSALLDKIRAPALIIWGADDKIAHVDNAEFLRQNIYGASTLILTNTGHVPMVETPGQVAKACHHFYHSMANAVALSG